MGKMLYRLNGSIICSFCLFLHDHNVGESINYPVFRLLSTAENIKRQSSGLDLCGGFFPLAERGKKRF